MKSARKRSVIAALLVTGCATHAASTKVAPTFGVVPTPAPTVSTAPPDYMAKAPPLGEKRGLTPPVPLRFTLPNGLEVVLLEKHVVPVVSFALVVKAGSAVDPAGRAGLASLVAEMLDEGANRKSALEVARGFEQLGANLGAQVDVDASTLSLEVARTHLEAAFSLFADVLLHPDFPARDYGRVRAERMAELLHRRVDPHATAQLIFANALYGANPYGQPTRGYLATIRNVMLSDLRQFYEIYYRPNHATLVVAGDLTAAECRSLVEKYLGSWKPRPIPVRSPRRVRTKPSRLILVDKPGAPQSVIRMGEPTVARSSPTFAALDLATNMLGGSFTSRLERNLRERNGYTYGAHAQITSRREPAPIVIGTDVFTNVTAPAVAELLKEYRLLRTLSPAPELAKVKALARSELTSRLEGSAEATLLLAELVSAGLSADDYTRTPKRLDRLDGEDLKQAASRYFDANRVTIVIVGDVAQIRRPLERLRVGRIEVRLAESDSPNGRPGKVHR